LNNLLARHIAEARSALASRRSFNKVFGIGGHKTGTTTLADVFTLCGLKVGNQVEGELTSYSARRGDYSKLIAYVQNADAFQDSPFAESEVFIALDALFPNSRFILTVRDPEDWFRSQMRFTAKRFGLADGSQITKEHIQQDQYIFRGYCAEAHAYAFLMRTPDYKFHSLFDIGEDAIEWEKLFDKDEYIRAYLTRNELIRRFFRGRPHQLLEIDMTTAETIENFAEFLGLPESLSKLPMPHANKT